MQCNPLNYFLIIFLYLASSALCPSVFSEEINLDPVIVTSSRLGQLEFGKLRALDTINYKEIRSYPLYSLADILGYLPSVDVRKRGACGIQADLSIRGSNFEQTLILLDGISLNDTQTGHFNIDLPLTMFDIERIEVLKGQASSLYGPNAFAGVVNIITKKPQGRKFIYEYSRGEYNLSSHGAYLSFPIEDFCTGISYEYKQASGYKPETEFIQRNFYANTYRSLDNMELSLSGGVMDKDFGASTFYSNLFPREEEHIRTSFSRLELKGENFDTAFYYRRHRDNFLL
ncbi:MAG: TonB-dependent receptor plug domain-containing protein, partial [Candidatus Omnitrophica bacterium]|nr:TonB-dependent receptor plug domain-containing protein [Candidatus Omnitrophota bacterium]